MEVRFERTGSVVTGCAVVLLAEIVDAVQVIRVFDSAHGFNEMHRFTRSEGKQTGRLFHGGSLGEGKRAAISEIHPGSRQMIEGWGR